jgi:hypothetical protein
VADTAEEGRDDGDDVAHVQARISPLGASPIPGICQEAVAGGGRGRSLHSTMASRFFRSFTISSPHGRATILVPHGAHQMVQRPVEALSPRGVSMSSSEVFGDSASTSCW